MIDHKKKSCDNTVLWLEIGVKKHLALQNAPNPTVKSDERDATCHTKTQNKDHFLFRLTFWPHWSATFVIMMALMLLKLRLQLGCGNHPGRHAHKPRLFLNCRLFQA